MSSDAIAWAFRHSPYKGATFLVHLAIGDSVNDQNGNELWMAATNLARKARVSRRAASTALDLISTDGYMTLLEQRNGVPSRYRFEFPETPVVFETRRKSTNPQPAHPVRRSTNPQPAQPAPAATLNLEPANPQPAHPVRTNPREPKQGQKQPKQGQDLAPLAQSEVVAKTHGPHHDTARSLAVLAFEQMVKPSTRGEFAGVKKRCEEALEAGWTEEQVSFVIRHGLVGAWTRDAVQFALTKAREAQNGNGSRSRSAVLNGSPVPLRDAVATLFRVDGNQREIGTGR